MLLAAFAYEVCGIILLVDNYSNKDNQCIKNIWSYVLVSLIAAVYSPLVAAKDRESLEKNICSVISITILNASLASWGALEMSNTTCNLMHDNHLLQFGLATFILQVVSAGLTLITVCCVGIICSSQNRDDERLLYNQI